MLQILAIQSALFNIGSCVATVASTSQDKPKPQMNFSEKNLENLEKWIDEMAEQSPPINSFILPGGGKTSAFLHICTMNQQAVLFVEE